MSRKERGEAERELCERMKESINEALLMLPFFPYGLKTTWRKLNQLQKVSNGK